MNNTESFPEIHSINKNYNPIIPCCKIIGQKG
jgi:hypothetical protein